MDTLILKGVSGGLTDLYTKLIRDHQGQVLHFLDPLTTLFKLGVIQFKPLGTKISIHGNSISIQDPTSLQGLKRWFYGDGRDHIYHLRLPLLYVRSLELGYITSDLKVSYLTQVKTWALDGLKSLRYTYEQSKSNGSLVRPILDEYIKYLTADFTFEDYHRELEKSPMMMTIYDSFTRFWTNRDLEILIELIGIIATKPSPNVKNVLGDSIERWVSAKDLEIDAIRPDM